ncbi:MAG: sigma-70 family RNA polymerase sigma factor [Chitinophagales bacterium]
MQQQPLIVRFQNKDTKAFEELYKMYAKSMHGVIFKIIKDESVTEEVLQDVFLKAWKKSHTYHPKKGRLFTWLINIARNAAIDKLRSKGFKKSKLNVDAATLLDNFHSHENLDSKVNSIGLQTFVNQLEYKYKNLIDLLYFKGYTHKEAAEEMQLPIGTIKTNNRKGIFALRKLLAV